MYFTDCPAWYSARPPIRDFRSVAVELALDSVAVAADSCVTLPDFRLCQPFPNPFLPCLFFTPVLATSPLCFCCLHRPAYFLHIAQFLQLVLHFDSSYHIYFEERRPDSPRHPVRNVAAGSGTPLFLLKSARCYDPSCKVLYIIPFDLGFAI
ncbi:MAG: hypothetical protein R2881_05705 [Eubacteriales bacterium]